MTITPWHTHQNRNGNKFMVKQIWMNEKVCQSLCQALSLSYTHTTLLGASILFHKMPESLCSHIGFGLGQSEHMSWGEQCYKITQWPIVGNLVEAIRSTRVTTQSVALFHIGVITSGSLFRN